MKHTVETVDEHDGCCFMCTCGEEFSGYSWEDVGIKFDNHVADMERDAKTGGPYAIPRHW